MSPLRWDVLLVGFVLALPVLGARAAGRPVARRGHDPPAVVPRRRVGGGRAAEVRERAARGAGSAQAPRRAVDRRTASRARTRTPSPADPVRSVAAFGVFLALEESCRTPAPRGTPLKTAVHSRPGFSTGRRGSRSARADPRQRRSHDRRARIRCPSCCCAVTPSSRAGPTTNWAASSGRDSSAGYGAGPTSTRCSHRALRTSIGSWSRRPSPACVVRPWSAISRQPSCTGCRCGTSRSTGCTSPVVRRRGTTRVRCCAATSPDCGTTRSSRSPGCR